MREEKGEELRAALVTLVFFNTTKNNNGRFGKKFAKEMGPTLRRWCKALGDVANEVVIKPLTEKKKKSG